jgi:enterochelin esterase-like enzyme
MTAAQPSTPNARLDCTHVDESTCTVERAWNAGELRARWQAAGAPVWADGDDLTYVYEGDADAVYLEGSVRFPLQQVADSRLWALTLRIDALPSAVITWALVPYQAGYPAAVAEPRVWRGPAAPQPPVESAALAGRVEEHELASAALGETRQLTIYVPPGHDPARAWPAVYLADGQAVASFARVVDPLIAAGRLPALLLVGVHANTGSASADLRSREYLSDINPRRYAAHERFVVEEVTAWAEQTFGATRDRARTAVFGFSNGAAFAAEMGERHPERFGTVIACSVAWDPGLEDADWTAGAAPRYYLASGSLEPRFRLTTAAYATFLAGRGIEHVNAERVSGHDFVMWREELPRALLWAFGGQ